MNPHGLKNPSDLAEVRKVLLEIGFGKTATADLLDLAADGFRFRAWINAVEQAPIALVNALLHCRTSDEHRKAIDKLIGAGTIRP